MLPLEAESIFPSVADESSQHYFARSHIFKSSIRKQDVHFKGKFIVFQASDYQLKTVKDVIELHPAVIATSPARGPRIT